MNNSYQGYRYSGLALDPIHVGTGGTRLGRVDNTIVRDPVTQIPKIPGSSLAGVIRAYAAMAEGKYPECAGQSGGKEMSNEERRKCPITTVFGYSNQAGSSGGFAGLASFSDMQVLLFPVATRQGPMWVTSPLALREVGIMVNDLSEGNVVYRKENSKNPINLGWLMLPVKAYGEWKNVIENPKLADSLNGIDENQIALIPDKLFTHVVNSCLEVRTSVSIDPTTGAAEDGALFTYEALPRGTVLTWSVVCRNPKHFRIGGAAIEAVESSEAVNGVVSKGMTYLEFLGIGGMGTRGMGRLKVDPVSGKEIRSEEPKTAEAS